MPESVAKQPSHPLIPAKVQGGKTEQGDPAKVGFRTRLAVEAQAFNFWAREWEPVLEPLQIQASFLFSPQQQVLSLDCEHLRVCLSAPCLGQLFERMQHVKRSWAEAKRQRVARRVAIWQPSQASAESSPASQRGQAAQQPPPAALAERGCLRVRVVNATGADLSLRGLESVAADVDSATVPPGEEKELGSL